MWILEHWITFKRITSRIAKKKKKIKKNFNSTFYRIGEKKNKYMTTTRAHWVLLICQAYRALVVLLQQTEGTYQRKKMHHIVFSHCCSAQVLIGDSLPIPHIQVQIWQRFQTFEKRCRMMTPTFASWLHVLSWLIPIFYNQPILCLLLPLARACPASASGPGISVFRHVSECKFLLNVWMYSLMLKSCHF